MQYILLLYGNENADQTPTDEAGWAAYMAPWEEYTAALQGAGVMLGGEALEPTSNARTVTATSGTPLITDGPFAETKEQLGGYYLLDCKTFDEAMAWAAKCPAVKNGRVEVRPIMNLEGAPG